MQCTDQVPPCLRRAAKGPWARAHDKRGKASSDEAETEDEELTRDHAGYAHAILPPPAEGVGLSKGQAVEVFFQLDQSGTGWFPGALIKVGTVGGGVTVRFADGDSLHKLGRETYGARTMHAWCTHYARTMHASCMHQACTVTCTHAPCLHHARTKQASCMREQSMRAPCMRAPCMHARFLHASCTFPAPCV